MRVVWVNNRNHELPDCNCDPLATDDDHLPDCPFQVALLQLLGADCEFVKLGAGLGHGRKSQVMKQAA